MHDTWSTLFMKQVLPRLDSPRKPYGKLCPLLMALNLLSAVSEAARPGQTKGADTVLKYPPSHLIDA